MDVLGPEVWCKLKTHPSKEKDYCDAYKEWFEKCLDKGSKSQKIDFKKIRIFVRLKNPVFIVILNPSLGDTKLKLNCRSEDVFTCKTVWENSFGESCTIYQDWNICTDKGREIKDDSDPHHFI